VARLVSFELSRKQPAKHALIKALNLISAAFDCSAVALPVPSKGHVRYLSRKIGAAVDVRA